MNTTDMLNQSIADHKAAIDKAEKELAGLEVTYSCGDRFQKRGEHKYILASTDYGMVNLISFTDGGRWTDSRKVCSIEYITQSEFNLLCSTGKGEFIRYYDSRKDEYVGEKFKATEIGIEYNESAEVTRLANGGVGIFASSRNSIMTKDQAREVGKELIAAARQ